MQDSRRSLGCTMPKSHSLHIEVRNRHIAFPVESGEEPKLFGKSQNSVGFTCSLVRAHDPNGAFKMRIQGARSRLLCEMTLSARKVVGKRLKAQASGCLASTFSVPYGLAFRRQANQARANSQLSWAVEVGIPSVCATSVTESPAKSRNLTNSA